MRKCLSRAAAALAALTFSLAPAAAQEAITLEAAIESAQRHPLARAAEARVVSAEGSRRSAGALANPVLTSQVENAALPGAAPVTGIEREVSYLASLPLGSLVQRWPRVRSADAELSAAMAEATVARREAALGAARAFHRVALAQVGAATAAEVLAGLEALVAYNRARTAAGAAAEGELLRAELERDLAATEAAVAELELERARAELTAWLPPEWVAAGVPLVAATLEGVPAVVPALPALEAALQRARAERPEIAAARYRVDAARSATALQRTTILDDANLVIGSKRVAGASALVTGVSVPLPFFDRRGGEVQRSRGDALAAEEALHWTERKVEAEVSATLASARRLSAQVASLGGSFLERAESVRRVSLAAYEEGAAPLLQVLDATRAHGAARRQYAELVFSRRQALLELNVAIGLDPLGAQIIEANPVESGRKEEP